MSRRKLSYPTFTLKDQTVQSFLSLGLILFCLLEPAQSQNVKRATFEPASSNDIFLRQVANKENIEIQNDTHLYISPRIKGVDGVDSAVLTPFAAPTLAGMFGANIIGPQSGPLIAYASTDKAYTQPQGKNARVRVITPGYAVNRDPMTPEEEALCHALRARTICDQFIVPTLGLLAGSKIKNVEDLPKRIYELMIAHNAKLIEDLGAVIRDGDLPAFTGLLKNFFLREVESNGPISKFVQEKIGESLKSMIAKKLVTEGTNKVLPFFGQLNDASAWAERGLVAATAAKTLDDLQNTPAKLEFFVYFTPGVSGASPSSFRHRGGRMANTTHELWISGFGFSEASLRNGAIRLGRSGSGAFHTVHTIERIAGTLVKTEIPNQAFQGVTGQIWVEIKLNNQWKRVPELLNVVGSVGATHIVPERGYGGQPAVIHGRHFYPLQTANEVWFRHKTGSLPPQRAAIHRISDREIHITIPAAVALAGTNSDWDVTVTENYGLKEFESEALPFTGLGERWSEVQARHRAGRMPEHTWKIQGKVDKANRTNRHNFHVPAGMELDMRLTDLTGTADRPHRASLSNYALWIKKRNKEGALTWFKVFSKQQVSGSRYRNRVVHTTAGDDQISHYQLVVTLWYSDEANYTVDLKTTARDDDGTGLDAPSDWKKALEMPVGRTVKGYLFGAPEKAGEDLVDWWQISNVPAGKEFMLQLSNLKEFHRGYWTGPAVQLGNLEIWRLTVDSRGVKHTKRLTGKYQYSRIESRNLPGAFTHREDQVCSYLIRAVHNQGYLQYWMKAEIR